VKSPQAVGVQECGVGNVRGSGGGRLRIGRPIDRRLRVQRLQQPVDIFRSALARKRAIRQFETEVEGEEVLSLVPIPGCRGKAALGPEHNIPGRIGQIGLESLQIRPRPGPDRELNPARIGGTYLKQRVPARTERPAQ